MGVATRSVGKIVEDVVETYSSHYAPLRVLKFDHVVPDLPNEPILVHFFTAWPHRRGRKTHVLTFCLLELLTVHAISRAATRSLSCPLAPMIEQAHGGQGGSLHNRPPTLWRKVAWTF